MKLLASIGSPHVIHFDTSFFHQTSAAANSIYIVLEYAAGQRPYLCLRDLCKMRLAIIFLSWGSKLAQERSDGLLPQEGRWRT